MKKKLLLVSVFCVLTLMAWSVAALAADPLCDDGLWKQMTDRARLNGQMDVARTENLVYKADSILEYSCLDQFINLAKGQMTYSFAPDFVNSAIVPLIQSWINTNYDHSSLGGRAQPEFTFAAGGAGYTCDVMKVVWNAAKCLNAGSLVPQDNLTSAFEFLKAGDIRVLPTACTAPGAAAFGATPLAAPVPAIKIGGIAPMPDCGIAVPTGNTIDLSDEQDTAYQGTFPKLASGRKYQEKVCINPACHYTPTSETAGTCDPPKAGP